MPEISRRDFLKIVGATAALGDIGRINVAEAQKEHEQSAELKKYIQTACYERQINKTEIPRKFEKITEQVVGLAEAIIEYNKGLEAMGGRDFGNMLKKALWEKFKVAVPNLGQFSQEKFYDVLVNNIPDYFLKFGIFAYPSSAHFSDAQGNMAVVDVDFKFLQIKSVKRDAVVFRGEGIDRKTLHVDALNIKGKNLTGAALYKSGPAETFGQNILLYDQVAEAISMEDEKRAPDDYAYYHKLSDETMWGYVKSHFGQEQEEWAADAAFAKLMRIATENQSQERHMDQTLTHETGHLAHFAEEDFKKLNPEPNARTAKENTEWISGFTTRAESRGKIAAIIMSKDKAWALAQLFLTSHNSAQDRQMVGHMLAGKRLRKMIGKELVQNADEYGITINNDPAVSPENQALFQITKVLEKPGLAEKLGNKLWELSQAADRGVRVSEKPVVVPNVEVKPGDAGSPMMTKQVDDHNPCGSSGLWVAGAAVAVAGAFGILAKRKAAVAEEQRREKQRKERKKGKKKR